MINNILEKDIVYQQNRFWLRIASACNNKCIFCLDSDAHNGTFPNEEEIKKQIKDNYKPGFDNRIILSGGEASINPQFSEYIRYAKEIGYQRIQTVTNGNMFAHIDFCKKVFDAGLQEVTFSFHGHNETLHDYLVATPGAFKKSLRGLLYIKKYFPQIIVNIDIVVNKINVPYLPDIISFFMKCGVYEYDILQIIPFGRGFKEHKEKLFYNPNDYAKTLNKVWKLSKIPGIHIWTNRFPVEVFEGYEELIQDPRKIKSETMSEAYQMYNDFMLEGKKPSCFGERCEVCFLKQYCEGILAFGKTKNIENFSNSLIINGKTQNELKQFLGKYFVLKGEIEVKNIYDYFGKTKKEFIDFIQSIPVRDDQILVNIPPCIRTHNNKLYYTSYDDIKQEKSLSDYTSKYISDLYRKKSLHCTKCKYNTKCQGIHINFIRAYGFKILQPIL